jgi:UDP-glucose 4-epimerase
MVLEGKRIIITGSSGLVGSPLKRRLEEEGAEIITIVKSTGTDITVWDQVKNYHDIDIIYHLAAKTYIPDAVADPRGTYWANINGTLNMLELGRRNKVTSFIFASSYVYGQPQYLPIDEKHPINPLTPYNRSKVLGEELCRAYYEDYKIRCVILRAFNIYGAGQRDSFLIPSILGQIYNSEIELNDPEPRRDFLYVEDAVEAYRKAADYSASDFEIFNIGLGKSHRVDEIVTKILTIIGRDVKVRYRQQPRENEIMNTVADISKARDKLGWQPKFDIEEGLRKTIAYTLRI